MKYIMEITSNGPKFTEYNLMLSNLGIKRYELYQGNLEDLDYIKSLKISKDYSGSCAYTIYVKEEYRLDIDHIIDQIDEYGEYVSEDDISMDTLHVYIKDNEIFSITDDMHDEDYLSNSLNNITKTSINIIYSDVKLDTNGVPY